MQYAGLAPRFGALAADFAILSLVFFPVTRLVKGVWLMSASEHVWNYRWFVTDPLCLIFLVIIIVYFIMCEGLAGGTVGKLLVGIRVIGKDGGRPGIRRAAVRNLLRIVNALPALNILGVWLIVTSPERARFGDRIAETRVVLKR